MTKENQNLKKLKEIIANLIGVEEDEIELHHSFQEDLHISASEFVELINALQKKGLIADIDAIDMSAITTVEDLVDELDIDV